MIDPDYNVNIAVKEAEKDIEWFKGILDSRYPYPDFFFRNSLGAIQERLAKFDKSEIQEIDPTIYEEMR